jgi:hypothetical protein
MKFSGFLSLSYFWIVVWAGGYHGVLERVLLYQAYQIDALNDPASQKIGFKCNDWDYVSDKCTGGYQRCRGQAPSERCNFHELMVHIGDPPAGTSSNTDANDPDPNRRLSAEQVATDTYQKLRTVGRVPDFRAQDAMNGDVHEFNEFLVKMSEVVNKAYGNFKNYGNGYLWDDFDSTMRKVLVARKGDHGRHLIEAAKQSEFLSDMTIQTQGLGVNPTNRKAWKTVDWEVTANRARANGIADAQTRIQQFTDDFYSGGSSKRHREVLDIYEKMQDEAVGCGRARVTGVA